MKDQLFPLDYANLDCHESSFTIPIIEDPEFSPDKMVFLVYNLSEKKRRRADFELDFAEEDGQGKGPGFGMPGGGVNPEHLESTEEAARREGGNESGLRLKKLNLIPFGKKNKVLVLDKKTEKLIRWVEYADGRQERVQIRKSEKALLNPFSIYLAEVVWPNSKPRQFFVELKNDLLKNHCDEDIIARMGLSANNVTREELLKLGVDEEEVDEIGGFALLPINHLRWMMENRCFYLDIEESPQEKREDGTTYVYYTHIKRILEGLDIMGVA